MTYRYLEIVECYIYISKYWYQYIRIHRVRTSNQDRLRY